MDVYKLALEAERLEDESNKANKAADDALIALEKLLDISLWESGKSKKIVWMENKGNKQSQSFAKKSDAIRAYLDGQLVFKKRG